MSEWKAGGKAMVDLIEGPGGPGTFHIPSSGGPYFLVSASALQDVPAADPHLALKTAVVEAVTAHQKDRKDRTLYTKMREAVGALEAALAPPKPDLVEVFFRNTDGVGYLCTSEGWQACADTPKSCRCRREIGKGLAAVEAARGAK